MIRINLLGVKRQKAGKTPSLFGAAQRTKAVSVLVMLVAMGGIGAWYWSLFQQATRLDAEIASAQQEATRLQGVLLAVKRAEDRRADLQQRVKVIEDLRQAQAVPVQLLDHVSHSVPDQLWLTALDQKSEFVQIEGRTTTLISLADFVTNLGTNKLVTKPIDIVNSEVEMSSVQTKGSVETIKFSVKAPLTPPAGGQRTESATPAGRGSTPPAAASTPAAATPRPPA